MVADLQRAARPAGDVPVPSLPAWARPLVAERSARRVAVIEGLGIRVVGDPARLLLPDGPAADEGDLAPDRISVEAAAQAVSGVVAAALARAQEEPPRKKPARPPRPAATTLADAPGGDVVHELGRRVRRRLGRPFRRG
jgi:hypothetical protein